MNNAAPTLASQAMSRRDYLFAALIMGLMGAFFWAIRGTGGFGGEQGGILAGVGWAILWHGFSRIDGVGRQRPYGHAAVIAAITFGIAIGGFTGYGVYNSWVRGLFYLDHPNGLRPVGAWTGYAMLFVCGLHWGGIPGAFLAWCAPRTRLDGLGWLARIGAGAAGAVVAYLIVDNFPQWFLPFYNEGLYQVAENKTCIRALGSAHTIAPHVGLFLGFLAFEIARRDWRAVGVMLVMSLGFAIPFSVGGYWHTLNDSALQISWWKNWEMSIGLGGGLAFGLAFYLFNRPDFTMTPRTTTIGELLAGAGIPMGIGVVQILTGGYDGFRRLHDLPWPELPDASEAIVLGGIALTGLAFLLWSRWQISPDDSQPGPSIPWWILMEPIDLIVIVGFLISIPKEMKLANTVLLVLYTVYIALSAVLFSFLLYRCMQRKALA